MNLLSELEDPQARRSKSARRIASRVLENPKAVLEMSIATLADLAGVSEPTVNRFCTGLGLKGFPDFKLKLAAELARNEPGITRDIEVGDSVHQVLDKIFESTVASLQATRRGLDGKLITEAVDILHNARSIVLCGQGASASVAMDAQHKLMIFGTPVVAHVDAVRQRMAALSLSADDCLVCISYTGRTIAMMEVAELGGKSGAQIVGITAPGSGLARRCSVVLPVSGNEDTDIYMPMSSRIAQLALIDVLATALALRKGPRFTAQLRRLKRSIVATRHPRGKPDVH